MAHLAFRTGLTPVSLEVDLGSVLRLSDRELLDLCRRNRDLRIERTAGGDLIVMTPAGGETSRKNALLVAALVAWAHDDGTGVVYDSSGGFLLPNGAMRAPDAAWVHRARLAGLSARELQGFVPLCPDFVIELRSPSDTREELRAKMVEYRENGARLGWLLDPAARCAHIYRPGQEVEVLEEARELSGDPELPGFTLGLEPIWSPL